MSEYHNPSLERIAKIFSVFAGIGGAVHGIGEVLQGNVPTEGIFINSWASGPIALYMGGEPGLTIVPNFLITGLLAIAVSSALMIWGLRYTDRPGSGRVILSLSILMLLFGGGVGPPVVGLLAGLAGSRTGSSLGWWGRRPEMIMNLLAGLWKPVWWITLGNGLLLFVGGSILPFMRFNNPDLFTMSFLLSIPLLLTASVTGISYDLSRRSSH